jgi:hypothetical protein
MPNFSLNFWVAKQRLLLQSPGVGTTWSCFAWGFSRSVFSFDVTRTFPEYQAYQAISKPGQALASIFPIFSPGCAGFPRMHSAPLI